MPYSRPVRNKTEQEKKIQHIYSVKPQEPVKTSAVYGKGVIYPEPVQRIYGDKIENKKHDAEPKYIIKSKLQDFGKISELRDIKRQQK